LSSPRAGPEAKSKESVPEGKADGGEAEEAKDA
jgi:hypothetical protein